MRRTLFVLILLGCAGAHAQSVEPATRVERMAALCKLWGAIEWFHPQLAGQDIDWDGALVQAIPKVDAATTDAEYRAAVDSLLAVLKDTATRTIASREASAARSVVPAIAASIRWTDDRIATLAIPDPNYFIANAGRVEQLGKMFIEARVARAVILDLRGNPRNDYWVDRAINEAMAGLIGESLAQLVGANFTQSSIRYRLHSGYAPNGDGSSGGYFSALVTREGATVETGNPTQDRQPLVILTDSDPAHLLPLLGGLQSAGLASVIHSGGIAPAGGPMVPMNLPGMTVLVRVGEFINPDGSLGFQPELILPARQPGEPDRVMSAALDAVRSGGLTHRLSTIVPSGTARPENRYRDIEYPPREYRLLALFRFWNTIHYFFPYQHLMDNSWDDLLKQYIPRIEAASDATAFHLTIAELATNLQDSHVSASSPVLSNYFGSHAPPLRVKFVENQTVITDLWGDASTQAPALQVGDTIVSIDGEEIAARRARIARYQAFSTPQALNNKVDRAVLAGAQGSKAILGIKGSNGRLFTATLTRGDVRPPPKQSPVYSVLEEGYGYFDLTRLTPQELDAAFLAIQDTPGLILDMRGYPRGIFFALASRLASRTAIAARFERPEIHAPEFQLPVSRTFTQSVTPGAEPAYRGKVVMLINEEAISQSEHTALFVETATDVTFIGGPTNGANGDVTTVGLPGGIVVRFSGHDVRHGDGRQLQRLGIQPNVVITPTLAGIRSGRDEVLEKAIEFLQKSTE